MTFPLYNPAYHSTAAMPAHIRRRDHLYRVEDTRFDTPHTIPCGGVRGMPYQFSDDDYHLMITRSQGQFGWKIRFDREPHPVLRSEKLFHTAAEASAAGESVLDDLKHGRTDHSEGKPDLSEGSVP